jgi:hypothetical protein
MASTSGYSNNLLPLNSANLPAIAQLRAHTLQAQGGSGVGAMHRGSDGGGRRVVFGPLPLYDRSLSSFDAIICHIGVGAFHRSHQEVFTHDLLVGQMEGRIQSPERWGVVGIGLRGATTRDVLSEQVKKKTLFNCVSKGKQIKSVLSQQQ